MHVPLSLYVHIPWCVRKCPYCDFNSHPLRAGVDPARYVRALLKDLESALPRVASRRLGSVFIGGGTPSLFPPKVIETLLKEIGERVAIADDAEITLEANPGAAESAAFRGYRQAGVNRISIGVQSFDDRALAGLGRIHSGKEAGTAVAAAFAAGFENGNLDLMFALPGQTPGEAALDVEHALRLGTRHLSYYQLTLEPNTAFHAHPPPLPDDETAWRMQAAGRRLLEAAGYRQYEVSAYARRGFECRHNLNYWLFGDYIGIGAGAHGKLTDERGLVRRTRRPRDPGRYLAAVSGPPQAAEERVLAETDLLFEFMLNALRLKSGFTFALFEARTGLPASRLAKRVAAAEARGLLAVEGESVRATPLGWRFLNDLVAIFLP